MTKYSKQQLFTMAKIVVQADSNNYRKFVNLMVERTGESRETIAKLIYGYSVGIF